MPEPTPQRADGRAAQQLRPLQFHCGYLQHNAASVLIECGNTRVLCAASLEEKRPPHRPPGLGWLTAEYGMLPAATHTRGTREAASGKQSSRTQEIQRLIGRALRASLDFAALGERTIRMDCDVLQADGGTRCASITGGAVALALLTRRLQREGICKTNPLVRSLAAVSVGLVGGVALLDMDYAEDAHCQADLNAVMDTQGDCIELQMTAEQGAVPRAALAAMLALAEAGVQQLLQMQQVALAAA